MVCKLLGLISTYYKFHCRHCYAWCLRRLFACLLNSVVFKIIYVRYQSIRPFETIQCVIVTENKIENKIKRRTKIEQVNLKCVGFEKHCQHDACFIALFEILFIFRFQFESSSNSTKMCVCIDMEDAPDILSWLVTRRTHHVNKSKWNIRKTERIVKPNTTNELRHIPRLTNVNNKGKIV